MEQKMSREEHNGFPQSVLHVHKGAAIHLWGR